MNAALRVREIRITPLAIPMRLRFEHAAAAREIADPIIVELAAETPMHGVSGFGETLARPYVTGETAVTVAADVAAVFAPLISQFHAESFPEAVEFADSLPLEHGGRCVHAARAAVELALLDLAGKAFDRPVADAATYLNLPGLSPPGCVRSVRYSGVVVGRKPLKRGLLLRLQRCAGLRDFKIKVAVDGWENALRRTARTLGSALARGAATLRADANGGWSVKEALAAIPILRECGVSALEQPLPRDLDAELPKLVAADCPDLIADESLLTEADAVRLIDLGVRVLNIRIAKNGGLLPTWRLAHRARSRGADVQLGCLVGETSILTAAGIAFLGACPAARFVEGAFGRWLLKGDVVRRPITFGLGGRVPKYLAEGLGVEVDRGLLGGFAREPATCIAL
ncbi:MAG: hypothetical protein AMXMBFR47_46110 [Planctomycetota bacterium]